jgi:hypothetical protein
MLVCLYSAPVNALSTSLRLRIAFGAQREPRSSWQGLEVAEELEVGFGAGADPVRRIEQLEVRIEELREAIERSRRLILAGRACALLGPALLVCVWFGLMSFTPFGTIIGIALGMGGLVLMGSSKASTEELELSLRQSEEERSAAVDALELFQFGD